MALRPWLLSTVLAALIILPAVPGQAQEGVKVHALSLADAPKYGPDFKHLDYVNPEAPKGGEITTGATGTYDSFNGFIIKGTGLNPPGLIETLTTSTEDDILSEYGLIAESMEVAPDQSWIIYNLRPEARWHDGKPIVADDVVWTFNALITEGDPQYRYYYADVTKAEALSERRVKFTFKNGGNRELPVIMGQLPVLPKHWWEKRSFKDVLLEPPLGSGPYKVGKFEFGRSLTVERVPDYWGKDLPISIGTDNYDRRTTVFFRDPEVQFEAFKSGQFDLRAENSAKRWATGYEFPAIKDGRVIKEKFKHVRPTGMQAFIMNQRRPVFVDRNVRQAMIYAFDFEWANKTLFFGEYKRTRSFFENSELAATGLPSPEELAILEPLRGLIPDEVFTTEYNPPTTDGSGNNRENLAKAAALLDVAGWAVVDGQRTKDGKPFKFEILLDDPAFERIAQPFVQNLKHIGIDVTIRLLADASQYETRIESFDYDMLISGWGQSLSPGNEQRDFWTSASADTRGSRNLAGIKNPAVDKLVDLIINTPSRHDLIVRCKALDRVLQWNYYVVPNWHLAADRIAYWNKFGMPSKRPDPAYGVGTTSWWIESEKDKTIEASQATDASSAVPATDPNATQTPVADPNTAQPTATQPATTQPAATPPSPAPAADRGQSPVIYGAVGLVAVLVAYALGRRRSRKS